MFDDNMQFRDGDEIYSLHLGVRASFPLTSIFKFWMAEVARDMLRLGVYFDALTVMMQVPGAAGYGWYCDNENKIDELIRESDRETVMDGLAACLEKVGAAHLMKQIPGWFADGRDEPPETWRQLIDELAEEKHGLLNLIATCLDDLLVDPGMAEIDRAVKAPWWHRTVPDKERESTNEGKEL